MNGGPQHARPVTPQGLAGLTAFLADPARALLVCDYDGTLAPIVADPTCAFPEHGAVDALTALADLVGTIAVLTGRPALTAVELGGLAAVPRLTILGAYGAQRWFDGHVTEPGDPDLAESVRLDVESVVARAAAGVRVELKGSAVAVHFRDCAEPSAAMQEIRSELALIATESGLTMEPGRLVLELRPRGMDKGSALTRLATESCAAAVVFIGDDLGDLAAFGAVEDLRSEHTIPGLTVASASQESPSVAQAADLVVDGPAGVVAFLRALYEDLRR